MPSYLATFSIFEEVSAVLVWTNSSPKSSDNLTYHEGESTIYYVNIFFIFLSYSYNF